MKKLTIVGVQINLFVGDITGNAQRMIEEICHAQEKYQADVVVFPELSLTSYPPEDLLMRSGFYKRCEKALEQIIDATSNTTAVIGYPEKTDHAIYNMAGVIQNNRLIDTYTKQALPNYTVFDEMRYFTPGKNPCVFSVKGIKIGIIICEDLWQGDSINQAAEAGAQIILVPNASPFDRNKVQVRENLLRKRAQQVNLPIIYVNLVGGQDELVFDGGSMVVDSTGTRCQQAKYFSEDHMVVEINIENNKPQIIHQPLPPRLSPQETVYKALVLGVQDYVNKNHFPGGILGLSGGVDSALTAAILVDALGKDRVTALMMPSRYTAKISLEDAAKQAEILGIEHHVVSIEPIFQTYLDSLADLFKGYGPDVTEENLQARIRGAILMALSNKTGRIVLTTGNKSELAVGYATLYGDMVGGFSVLKDILKTQVYELCQYRNEISPIIPQRVLERAPSAELAPHQKDQDVLPPYPLLDQILIRYIEKDEDPHDIISAGFPQKIVLQVVKMINRNEYKRRQAPLGIRITERGFGKDRRYPITSGYTKNI